MNEAIPIFSRSDECDCGIVTPRVLTRRIQEIVAHLSIDQLSPTSAPQIPEYLDNQVQTFLVRPIEQPLLYIFVDASYYKVREGVRHVTKVALVVAGVREDGLPGDHWARR